MSASSHPVLALLGRDDKVQRFENVSAQTEKAARSSTALAIHIYSAGRGGYLLFCCRIRAFSARCFA